MVKDQGFLQETQLERTLAYTNIGGASGGKWSYSGGNWRPKHPQNRGGKFGKSIEVILSFQQLQVHGQTLRKNRFL